MAEHPSRTISGKPARSAESELKERGKHERNMRERTGFPDDDGSLHPLTQETGEQGDSNVGQDLTSGAEGIEDPQDVTNRRD